MELPLTDHGKILSVSKGRCEASAVPNGHDDISERE